MSSTEAPFRATINLDINGHKILLTAGGDSIGEFQLRWAELGEGMGTLVESFTHVVAGQHAAPLVNAAPQQDNPWQPQPQPTPSLPQPVHTPNPGWSNPQPPQGNHGPTCKCGQPMIFRSGEYGPFYACPKPREQQCRKDNGKGYTVKAS